MNLDTTLKARLEIDTGFPVYALEKPIEKGVPCTVYRYIGETPIITIENFIEDNDTRLRKARIQITSIANTYSAMVSLVKNTEQTLYGNNVNFEVSLPIGTKIQDKEDNLYYSVSEYYIWYTAD
jgi:hypothetical protein